MAKDTALEYLESQLSEHDETFSSGSGTPPFRRPYGIDHGLQARNGGAPPPPMNPAASSSTAAGNGFSFLGMQQGLRKPDLSGLVGQLNTELRSGNVPRSPRLGFQPRPTSPSPSFSPPVPVMVPLMPPPPMVAYPPMPQAVRSASPPPGRPVVAPPKAPPPKSPWSEEDDVDPAALVASQITSQLREREEVDARSIIEPARPSMPPRQAPVPSWLPPPVDGFAWPNPVSHPPPMSPRGSLLLVPPGSPRAMSPPPMLRASLSPGGSFVAPMPPGSPGVRPPMLMSPGPLSPGGSLKAPVVPGASASVSVPMVAPAPPPCVPMPQASVKARMPSSPSQQQSVASPSKLSFHRSPSMSMSTPRETPRDSFMKRRSNPDTPVIISTAPSPLPCWSKAPPMQPSAKPSQAFPGGGTWKATMASRGPTTPMPGVPTPPQTSRGQATPMPGTASPPPPMLIRGQMTPMPGSPRQSNKTGPARRISNPGGYQAIKAPRSITVLAPADRTVRAPSPGPQHALPTYQAVPQTEVWNSMSTPR